MRAITTLRWRPIRLFVTFGVSHQRNTTTDNSVAYRNCVFIEVSAPYYQPGVSLHLVGKYLPNYFTEYDTDRSFSNMHKIGPCTPGAIKKKHLVSR